MSAVVPELVVADLSRSLAFWCGVCGFVVRYDRPEEGFAYLEREGAEVMLDEEGQGRTWATAALDRPLGRGVNLQITVAELGPLLAAFERAGVVPFAGPEQRWYRIGPGEETGVHQVLVCDPDGYLLRFQASLGARVLPEV